MRERTFDDNVLSGCHRRLKQLDRRASKQLNQRNPTVPIYDLPNNPPANAVEGQFAVNQTGKGYWFLQNQWRTCEATGKVDEIVQLRQFSNNGNVPNPEVTIIGCALSNWHNGDRLQLTITMGIETQTWYSPPLDANDSWMISEIPSFPITNGAVFTLTVSESGTQSMEFLSHDFVGGHIEYLLL